MVYSRVSLKSIIENVLTTDDPTARVTNEVIENAQNMATNSCLRCMTLRKSVVFRGYHTTGLCHATQPVAASTGKKVINIPKKIVRDETAVLRALASTVKRDYGGPPYQYIDDPYLTPRSHLEKRMYALSKVSGRKAAQYVVENYPQYFNIEYADPKIEAYMPKGQPKLEENTEAGLLERIDRRLPLGAFQSYQRCREAGVSMSQSTRENLLALLCIHNSSDEVQDLQPEEANLMRDMGQGSARKVVNTWKNPGPAEEVFEELPEKTVNAYECMIRGCAKYFGVDRASELYRAMQEQGLKPSRQIFNAMLSISSFLGSRYNERWSAQMEILKNMEATGVSPDLMSFTDLMYALTRSNKDAACRDHCMSVLNEMKELNIEPNLAIWFHVLRIFYNEREAENPSEILFTIINKLKDTEFAFTHPDDYEFFSTAMALASQKLRDLELGYKIDELLNYKNNVMLVGDAFRESVYYSNFIKLICTFEQIDKIMEQYDRVTPHAYTPTHRAVEDLLLAIELNEGYHYVPKIFSDLMLFDYSRNRNFITSVLTTIAKKKFEESLQKQFMKIADTVLEQVNSDAEKAHLTQPLTLSGTSFGDVILIYVYGKEFQKAWSVFQKYHTNRMKIEQFPSEKSLIELTQICIDHGDVDKTMLCIKTMGDFAYPKVDEMIMKAKKAFQLTREQEDELDDL